MENQSKDYKLTYAEKLPGEDNYGNVTVAAKFEGEADSALWRVSPKTLDMLVPGFEVYGHIEEKESKAGNLYLKFVRDKNPEPADSRPQAKSGTSHNKSYPKKDNSDGMRQGMCINNATAYVNSEPRIDGQHITPELWAERVFEFANALYRKGDLTQEDGEQVTGQTPEQITPAETAANGKKINMTAIDEMFPESKKVQVNHP